MFTPLSTGADTANTAVMNLQNLYDYFVEEHPGNSIIFEVWYPEQGDIVGHAEPSPEEQLEFIEGILDSSINYMLFSFTDERNKPFKEGHDGNVTERSYGLFEDNRMLKPHLSSAIYIEPKKTWVDSILNILSGHPS